VVKAKDADPVAA